jgi:hypothetical protein
MTNDTLFLENFIGFRGVVGPFAPLCLGFLTGGFDQLPRIIGIDLAPSRAAGMSTIPRPWCETGHSTVFDGIAPSCART